MYATFLESLRHKEAIAFFLILSALFLQCVINVWDSVIRLKGRLQLKTPLLKVVSKVVGVVS
jgi:hypothetical protein